MPEHLTNLLPQLRKQALSREYFLRLAVVLLELFVALVLAAGVLLIPTYVFLAGSARAKGVQLTEIKSSLSPADEKSLSARLVALSGDAAALIALSKKPFVSKTAGLLLAVARPGVTLTGFSYTSAGTGKPATLALSGLAMTRDALRDYQLALQAEPFVVSAGLPVSAYAKITDITFTITITLAP